MKRDTVVAIHFIVVPVVVVVFLGNEAICDADVDGSAARSGNVDTDSGAEVETLVVVEPAIANAHGVVVGEERRTDLQIDERPHQARTEVVFEVGIERNHHRRFIIIVVFRRRVSTADVVVERISVFLWIQNVYTQSDSGEEIASRDAVSGENVELIGAIVTNTTHITQFKETFVAGASAIAWHTCSSWC